MSDPIPSANVAILRTASGAAAIAVIRLRGPGVDEFLRKCFSKPAMPGQCVHGELRDGDSVLDDPVVVMGKNSQWADISLHGGDWVVRSVLELAKRRGFAIVEAGLPLPDAALDDAGSILDREVEAHLPLARTELAIRVLLAQPENWRRAQAGKVNAAEILEDRSLWWLLNPPQVAIVGEPNVGKSTLANQLFGEKRSITADIPGTTRDWVGDIANIDGLAVHLIDTPGLRETHDEIEKAAIIASAEKIAGSDLKICVLDATQAPAKSGGEGIVVINKIDQAAAWDFAKLNAVPISAKTGFGIDALRSKICEYFHIARRGENEPRWWTTRQAEILRRAVDLPFDIRAIIAGEN